ncbi:calmodulin-interacting protein 111 isoform X2 [Cynara cardunculus var. scolymus]|uniref:calmodulin-interacting protein 111 isoform X2 n=1 Tax=Cynara cardunculus var. scolymus TaxID=59895 RepID=UPI000D62C220|nr:calmodulin-interacting protein 111 isoform X2 [Cynara cardunculus var. scolymus]
MPPKSKKNSKSKAFSHSDAASPSPHSSSSSYSNPNPGYNDEDDEQLLLRSLEEISTKYPSFIGTSALICRLIEDPSGGIESKGCKIWLSEASMVASSITPGSIVSVSLASLRKDIPGYSLSSLADECARHYGFNEKIAKEIGNYFVLATVFPSCKVSKNGVRLSSSLSSAMGYPISDRILFVYPVNNGNKIGHNSAVDSFSIYRCKDLHLLLVSSKRSISTKSNKPSHFEFSSEHNGHIENGNISSPKTPSLSRSRLSSPCSSRPTSPRHTESVLNSFNPSFDSFNIREVLEDDVGKKLLQTCTVSLLYSRHLLCGNLVVVPILSELCLFKVVGAEKVPELGNNGDVERKSDSYLRTSDVSNYTTDAFLVGHGTKVQLSLGLSSEPETSEKTYIDIYSKDSNDNIEVNIPKLGGLSKEYSILKDIIISSSVKNTLSSMGLRPTKGVLLHGPPGTGKTSLARLCANDAGVNLFSVNGPEFISQFYGESEQALHAVFDSASNAAPAVVFIDELDAIAPSRKEGGEELSERIVATLLNLMDGISRTEGLLVIAATNRPDSIEPALRRPGRLDREIEISVPSPFQRYDILLALLNEKEHHLSDTEIHHVAMTTHGFVGADLASLCNEAAFVCLRRCIGELGDELLCYQSSVSYNKHPDDNMKASSCSDNMKDLYSGNNLEYSSLSNSELHLGSVESDRMAKNLSVSLEDFEKARIKVRPSAMREVILEVPKVSWKDVGGQEEVKMQLMEAVEWPQKHQDAFKRIVKGPELFSKWVGESEKAVRSLFAKARANAPSIVFFDELDGLANIRGKENDGVSVSDRVISQLLVELDGLSQRVNVTVIAATNRPDKIDSALMRPGRFDRLVYVGPPNEKDREEIFCIHLSKMTCSSDVCIKELALLSEGCTGADISLICREAAVAAIEEKLDASEVTMKHLRSAIEQVQPSDVDSYQELTEKFQRLVSVATPNDDSST